MSRRRGRPRISGWYITINSIFAVIATGIAAAAFWPVYGGIEFIVAAAAALAVGALIGAAGALMRWTTLRVTLTAIASFLVIGVPLAVPSLALYSALPTVEGLWSLISGLALSWKQLLTISLPVGDYEALLVPAFFLALATSLIAVTVAIRAKFGDLAVLAPILLFIVAILFGPDFALWPRTLALALMVMTLLWLIWRRWYQRRESIRRLSAQSVDAQGRPLAPVGSGFVGVRTVLSGGLIIAVACGGAVAIADVAPPLNERTVLRDAVEQPFDPRNYSSPLTGFRNYWREPVTDTVLFSVDGLPTGARIRLATLDSYDGIVYSVGSDLVSSTSGSFTRVPFRFDQSSVAGIPVTVTVKMRDFDTVWVPTVGDFESISFTGDESAATRNAFYYNNVSKTAAVIGGLHSGDSYRLGAVVPEQPTEAELAALDPGAARVPTPATLPVQLGVALDKYVEGVDAPGERLVAMINGLRADGYISHGIDDSEPASRSGHAADRIDELLTASRMIGDGEQYAVTAALMAAQLGFPARVVVGFIPQDVRANVPVDVLGADVSSWIEVNTAQFGWVSLDVTPPVREIPDEIPREPAQVARPVTVVPPPITDSETIDRQNAPESVQDQPNSLDPVLLIVLAVLQVVAWLALVLAIILAPFIVIVGAKLRRRRLRRNAPSSVDQITGGWHEFEDAVVDHGFAPPPSATRSELAATFGGMQSRILASVADRAVFAPIAPDEAEVESVWRAVDDLRATLDIDRTRWDRIRAAVSLRSLGGYSVTRFLKRK